MPRFKVLTHKRMFLRSLRDEKLKDRLREAIKELEDYPNALANRYDVMHLQYSRIELGLYLYFD